MIEQLMVKDYILFDYALIDFNTGLSVITGETGAGKSLLIDAISYLCGDRISSNIIRNGKEKCILQIVFSRPCQSICDQLEEDGFEIEDLIIVQRTIHKNGKSTVKLNRMNTTLSYIRSLMHQLMDIHSQMDTYQLMDEEVQLNLLDQYAKCTELKEKVKETYRIYNEDKKEYEKAKNETFSDDELDYITSCINEIQEMNIAENELETLQNQIKQANSFQKNIDDYNHAIYLLDCENGIIEKVYELNKILSKNSIFNQNVESEYFQLDALNEDLKHQRDQYQNEQFDIDALQEREYQIRKCFRKYGGSYSSMKNLYDSYMKKVDLILHRQDVFEKLEKKMSQSKKNYNLYADKLHHQRLSVIPSLCEKVEAHCKDLMLENARFKIDLNKKCDSSNGYDQVQFMVSMNPGQPFSLLKKSASGGELSRLMLALKVVFQADSTIETILFDEIDTGVSGKVAYAMGNKMHTLSKRYQVLCITHLASVACWADRHYRVYKETKEENTTTFIEELNKEQSIEELAVMATGNKDRQAIESARELKKRAHHG